MAIKKVKGIDHHTDDLEPNIQPKECFGAKCQAYNFVFVLGIKGKY